MDTRWEEGKTDRKQPGKLQYKQKEFKESRMEKLKWGQDGGRRQSVAALLMRLLAWRELSAK